MNKPQRINIVAFGLLLFFAFVWTFDRCCRVARPEETAKAVPVQRIEVLPTEADAVAWAFTALLQYPEADRPYMAFVWLPPYADPEWIGAVDFAMNAATSQTRILHRADRHAGGWLLAYNLRRFAPGPELARLVEVWDSIAADESRFHLPSVNVQEVVETINVEQRDPRTNKIVQVPQQRTRQKTTTVAILAPHLQEALAKHATDAEKSERVDVLLAQMTASAGRIYPADWLLEQLLTSVRGKYPEFRQMPGFDGAAASSFSQFQSLLSKRGFFFEQSRDLSGDKGSLLLISGVTGKSRVIQTTFGLASRQPMAVTFDYRDSRIRPDQQFVRNLITFDALADAKEAFLPMPNGLVEYVLADSAGKIQRAAPPDIVADSTKPDGHTKELEMGMSCVVCHAPENGYKTARNDMEILLGSDIDFIGDAVSYENKDGETVTITREQATAIVVGRYGERIDEPDGVLGRARRDLIKTVDALTDYKPTADGPTSVALVGAKIKEIYHRYRYQTIDAERAALELGVRVPAGQGLAVFRALVPAPAVGESEDIILGLLRNGATIKRDDWSAVYVEAARRAVANRSKLKS